MATLATAPFVIVPRSHETTPASFVHEPCDETAETNVRPAGSASVTTTLLAVARPRLVRLSVNVALLPTFTSGGETDCDITISANGPCPLQQTGLNVVTAICHPCAKLPVSTLLSSCT